MALQTDGIVIKNERIQSHYFLMTIDCPPISNEIKTGQFIMLKTSNNFSPLLRRPFSVYKWYPLDHSERRKRGWLLLLYKIVGRGTQKMTEIKKGQKVNIIGPLGNGFTLPSSFPASPIILIAGGIGIASLYSLAEALNPSPMVVFIGGKSKEDLLCLEEFEKLNVLKILIATEDGSLGYPGTVIDLFLSQKKNFEKKKFQYIYSSGPLNMLKKLASLVKSEEVICQASMEARMGCGFGACWGCVIKTNDLRNPYQRVCKEGPVFNLKNIVWE